MKRPKHPTPKSWTECPECGVGRGDDHKGGCTKKRVPALAKAGVSQTMSSRKRGRKERKGKRHEHDVQSVPKGVAYSRHSR